MLKFVALKSPILPNKLSKILKTMMPKTAIDEIIETIISGKKNIPKSP